MSPALSKFTEILDGCFRGGPVHVPGGGGPAGVREVAPVAPDVRAMFQTSVPSMPRPNWPLDLLVRAAASVQTWAIVVGGPAMLAAAKSALFQKNT